MTAVPHAGVNGVEIWYEAAGEPTAEPLLLVPGLGAQYLSWDDDLVDELVGLGYFVIRVDNRDVGLSTMFTGSVDVGQALGAVFSGEPADVPYLLADMAADLAALVGHLGLDRVHVAGRSMGGMIAQQLTIDRPDLVATLTSVMSTTGDPDVGGPTPEAMTALMGSAGGAPSDREAAIARSVETTRAIASPVHFDEERSRDRATRAYDRNADRDGMMRQLLAVMASPSRSEALAAVSAPTMVIHGELDPLVQPSGGVRTAEAVPGAELHLLADMGHDLEPPLWPDVVPLIIRHTGRAPVTTRT